MLKRFTFFIKNSSSVMGIRTQCIQTVGKYSSHYTIETALTGFHGCLQNSSCMICFISKTMKRSKTMFRDCTTVTHEKYANFNVVLPLYWTLASACDLYADKTISPYMHKMLNVQPFIPLYSTTIIFCVKIFTWASNNMLAHKSVQTCLDI